MIEIKQNISLNSIDELYKELERCKDANEPIDLKLPKKLNGTDLGILFSFLQFIATWVRNSREGHLYLPITPDEIERYLNEEFVYPTIALAWEKKIFDVSGNLVKQALKTPSQEYFQRMELLAMNSNGSVPIYCFDHDKNKRGHSRMFYKSSQELYSEVDLGHNLTQAFKKVSLVSPQSVFNNSIRPVVRDFFAIIHELFTNTNEHAKTDVKGYNLYPNIRALHLKFHGREIDEYLKMYSYNSGLVQYFKSDFELFQNETLYLIEISVLDSGPGLVKRYTKKNTLDVSIEDEIAIIKECLQVHNTSNTSERAANKGLGLDRVLQTLDAKGFVRIKTGRAEIFRDLKTHPYKKEENHSDIILNDWNTNTSSSFTTHPPAEGTLISIFYPLSSK